MKPRAKLFVKVGTTAIISALIALVATNSSGPEITVDNGHHQSVGRYGFSQNFYNVSGKASDPNGIFKLSYRVNESKSRLLSIGPDTRRLAGEGDFNADIPVTDLTRGSNRIELNAIDWLGRSSSSIVELIWDQPEIDELPTDIDWGQCDSVSDVAQVVDGPWAIDGKSVVPLTLAYDRLLAVGSIQWENYEVLTSFRVTEIDHAAFGNPVSISPALGILLRWQGHSDWGKRKRSRLEGLIKGKWQPFIGWTPWGGGLWCDFEKDETGLSTLITNWPDKHYPDSDIAITIGTEYMVKILVCEYKERNGTNYAVKVWEKSKPEPETWAIENLDTNEPLRNGSILLVAHHLIAEFGSLEIQPISTPSS